MARARKIIRRVAPALVAVLVIFVVFGGAAHIAKEVGGGPDGDSGGSSGSLTKMGLGLCAASVAVIIRNASVRRKRTPLLALLSIHVPVLRSGHRRIPPVCSISPPGRISLSLLQVIRI
jgi:hypothetical protein